MVAKFTAKKGHIPVHAFHKDHPLGFELFRIDGDIPIDDSDNSPLVTHRDDFYMFCLQEAGMCEFMLDFKMVKVKGPHICFMCPGQVHRYIKVTSDGWILAVDKQLMPAHLAVHFESAKKTKQVAPLRKDMAHLACLQLIKKQLDNGGGSLVNKSILYSLIEAFLGITAQSFWDMLQVKDKPLSRSQEITNQFRKLVQQKFTTIKKPGEYAALLNISVSYLNEVVKENTGFTASYLIQEEIFLEAKRLLYHTQLSAKGIAFKLGYDDPTYFSRLFRKHTGQTPLAFRDKQLH